MTRGALEPAVSELAIVHDDVLREGHPLIRKEHVLVTHLDPFRLAMRTTPGFIEQAIVRVSTFAFVLSAIVATIVALGAAPWPIAILVAVWLGMATFARLFVRRRKRELGDHLVDFERALFVHLRPGAPCVAPLETIALATAEDPLDDKARWVTVRIRPRADDARGAFFRIAYGSPAELERILFLFRRYGVREIERPASD